MFAATVLIGTLVLLLFVQLPPIAVSRQMWGILRKARLHWPVLLGISVVLTAVQFLLPWIERIALTPVIGSDGPRGNIVPFALLILYDIVKSLFGWAFSISLLSVLYGHISGSRPLR